MIRLTKRLVVTVLFLAGAALPALAQETKVEIGGGVHYPLISQLFYAKQGPAFHIQAGLRINAKLTIGALAETQTSESRISHWGRGDVKQTFYGVTGKYAFSGEPDFRLVGIVSVGVGKVTFDNPEPEPAPGLVNDTDIKLWYEAGFGAEINTSKHLSFLLSFTARQVQPKEASMALRKTRFCYVPKASIFFRF